MSEWYKPDPTKWYKIVPEADENYCIDIEGPAWTDGQDIHLWTYAGNNNQMWKFISIGDGYYNIVSRGGANFGIHNPGGTEVPLEIHSVGGDEQKWKLTDAGGGCCRIAAMANNSAYIDLRDGDASDGSVVQLYINGANTKWKTVEVQTEVKVFCLDHYYYVDNKEVTQSEYQAIIGNNPSLHQGPNYPVENITWWDAILYCNARSKAEGLDTVYVYTGALDRVGNNCISITGFDYDVDYKHKYGYRLPAELEWKAAYYKGSGRSTGFFWDAINEDPATYAWYDENAVTTNLVAQLSPNPAGLFDIAGNVSEWVWYSDGDNTRVYGGSFDDGVLCLAGNNPMTGLKNAHLRFIGFRVVRTYR
jgi:hypothetical protein